jgi:hypothetical protein
VPRVVFEQLAPQLGQPGVVENPPGAARAQDFDDGRPGYSFTVQSCGEWHLRNSYQKSTFGRIFFVVRGFPGEQR